MGRCPNCYIGLTSSTQHSQLDVTAHLHLPTRATPELRTECSDSTSQGCGFPAAAFPSGPAMDGAPVELKLYGPGLGSSALNFRDLIHGVGPP